MFKEIMAFLTSLTDSETLIVVGLLILCFMNPQADVVSAIVGGFLGYMVKKGGNGNGTST